MSEEEVKIVLQDLCETENEVHLHLQKIRMLSKGYWLPIKAKEYLEELTQSLSN